MKVTLEAPQRLAGGGFTGLVATVDIGPATLYVDHKGDGLCLRLVEHGRAACSDDPLFVVPAGAVTIGAMRVVRRLVSGELAAVTNAAFCLGGVKGVWDLVARELASDQTAALAEAALLLGSSWGDAAVLGRDDP